MCAMIRFSIRETAVARGIPNAHQLALALGVADNVGVRLWNEKFARIDLITLDRLCRTLRCQPNKLFRYEPDDEG